jgi:phosphate transport system substrate-binding protein
VSYWGEVQQPPQRGAPGFRPRPPQAKHQGAPLWVLAPAHSGFAGWSRLPRLPFANLFLRVSRLLVPLMLLGACAGDPPPPVPAHANDVLAPTPEALLAMGSGAATPLLQALARAYAATRPALLVRVEPSVGTSGGVAAATDGAVDLGLVGRGLRPNEQVALELFPLALDAVVLAAAADVERQGLSREEVRKLYAGDRATGLTLLLRDPAETANDALERAYPELQALRESGAASARFRVIDHDDAMAHALLTTPRGVGVFSFGAIRTWGLPLRPLALDGVQPGVNALASKTWPAVRTLGVVYRAERRGRIAPFLAFIASPEGRAVTRGAGYLPLPEGAR